MFKFAGLGSEEASVEICFCPYKFPQVGGGGGSILGIEGDISFLRDWSYHLQHVFWREGLFFLNLTTCLVVVRRMSVKEVTRTSTLGLVRLRQFSRRIGGVGMGWSRGIGCGGG